MEAAVFRARSAVLVFEIERHSRRFPQIVLSPHGYECWGERGRFGPCVEWAGGRRGPVRLCG
jgi:hypothetical protein